MSNPKIESAPDPYPTCRHCGKTLSPNYDTRYEQVSTRVEPSDCGDEGYSRKYRRWCQFDGTSGDFYFIRHSRRVISRTWKGTFGPYRDGYFCSLRCGHAFAVDVLDRASS